jgi:hypothetical protein
MTLPIIVLPIIVLGMLTIKFRIQIVKQEKQKQEHDTCKTLIQEDFIASKKQKQNKVVKKNVTKTSVEQIEGNEDFTFI